MSRRQSEMHETSMEDIHMVAPAGFVDPAASSRLPGLLFSQIKQQARNNTSHNTRAQAQAHSAGIAGIEEKEEILQLYMTAGQECITPYYCKGVELELSSLIQTLQELHTARRAEVTEFNIKQKETLDLEQFTEGLQLMDRVGKDYMRRCIYCYDMSYGESRCGRCGHSPGSMGARHAGHVLFQCGRRRSFGRGQYRCSYSADTDSRCRCRCRCTRYSAGYRRSALYVLSVLVAFLLCY